MIAQLVEQRTENPCVGSSILPHSTFSAKLVLMHAKKTKKVPTGRLVEWLNTTVLKAVPGCTLSGRKVRILHLP